MTTILALDCSFSGLTLAARHQGRTLGHVDATPRASDTLHLHLKNLLDQLGAPASAIEVLAVTTGPGSFTGIRLGLAVAHALQLVSPSLEVIGLPTMGILARQYVAKHAPQQQFTVLLNAAGGQLYAQSFGPDAAPQAEATVISGGDIPQMPLYMPTGLALTRMPQVPVQLFSGMEPEVLLAAVEDTALHVPAVPTYLKPLTYKKQNEA